MEENKFGKAMEYNKDTFRLSKSLILPARRTRGDGEEVPEKLPESKTLESDLFLLLSIFDLNSHLLQFRPLGHCLARIGQQDRQIPAQGKGVQSDSEASGESFFRWISIQQQQDRQGAPFRPL